MAATLRNSIASDTTFFMGDDSRKAVIEHYCWTIGCLVAGILVGQDRYNSLLLGRQAVGKSKIIDVVTKACKGVLADRMTVVKVVAKQASHLRQLKTDSLHGVLAASIHLPLTSDIEVRCRRARDTQAVVHGGAFR